MTESTTTHEHTCNACGADLAHGDCTNIGACFNADRAASRMARGESAKARMAPMAFTIRGDID